MAEKKISIPAGSIGILKFYEAAGGKIKITPQLVLGISVIFIFLIILLRILL
ncbi:MAG: preprotein translocase subunit Sec61beta [Candidatus Aenigmatarchaeota archaeon]